MAAFKRAEASGRLPSLALLFANVSLCAGIYALAAVASVIPVLMVVWADLSQHAWKYFGSWR